MFGHCRIQPLFEGVNTFLIRSPVGTLQFARHLAVLPEVLCSTNAVFKPAETTRGNRSGSRIRQVRLISSRYATTCNLVKARCREARFNPCAAWDVALRNPADADADEEAARGTCRPPREDGHCRRTIVDLCSLESSSPTAEGAQPPANAGTPEV